MCLSSVMPGPRRLRQRMLQVQGQPELHTSTFKQQKFLISKEKKSVAGGMAQQLSVYTALEVLILAPSTTL